MFMSVSPTKIHSSLFTFFFFILLLASSCTVVKKYKPYKPFVFENEIAFDGKMNGDEKNDLRSKLEGQIEDSVKPQFKSVLFVRHVMTAPAVFDSSYVKQSLANMNNLLHNNGYYRGNITANWKVTDTVIVKNKPDQYRMKVTYDVDQGKIFRIDSISYSFNDTALQRLAEENAGNSLLKKSDPFNRGLIDEELNRLIDIFRNNA